MQATAADTVLCIIPFLGWDWDSRSEAFLCMAEIWCSYSGFDFYLAHSASGSFSHSPIFIIMNVSCSGPGDKTKACFDFLRSRFPYYHIHQSVFPIAVKALI